MLLKIVMQMLNHLYDTYKILYLGSAGKNQSERSDTVRYYSIQSAQAKFSIKKCNKNGLHIISFIKWTAIKSPEEST